MGNFLNSEIVRKSLEEIYELQSEIYYSLGNPNILTKKEKHEQLDKLEKLLEKQRIMHTRITLSDDPDAIKMREEFEITKANMGIPPSLTAEDVFDSTELMIDRIRKSIDETP